jgi:hypothetical protein
MKRRRIDVILDPAYLDGVDDRSLEELGEMRDEVDGFENELSFYRRVLHGRLDVLRFEQRRRSGEDQRSVLDALPELLAAGMGGGSDTEGSMGRLRSEFAPDLPEVERRFSRVMDDDVLTRLPDLSDDDLALAIQELGELEQGISERRSRLHEIHDALVGQIGGRHVSSDPA